MDDELRSYLDAIAATKFGDPLPEPPPDRRHPLEVLDGEIMDELAATFIHNLDAMVEGRPEDVQPTGWLLEQLQPPDAAA